MALLVFIIWCLQVGSPYQKAKRLRVLADVSGSMYRFNGVDGRLERSMEAVCMVMEALEGFEDKFKVKIPQTYATCSYDWPKPFLHRNKETFVSQALRSCEPPEF